MQFVKNFFRSTWDMIITLQTARAAAHLARCGCHAEVRELMLDKPCSK